MHDDVRCPEFVADTRDDPGERVAVGHVAGEGVGVRLLGGEGLEPLDVAGQHGHRVVAGEAPCDRGAGSRPDSRYQAHRLCHRYAVPISSSVGA